MEFETFDVTVRPFDGLDEDQALAVAVEMAREGASMLIGTLATRVLGRPDVSDPGYLKWVRAEQDLSQAEQDQHRVEWHLAKLKIRRALGLDQTGDVINARMHGASWQVIGDVCGISRQAAYDRWARCTRQTD